MRKILVCLLVVFVDSSVTNNTPIHLLPNTNESGIDVAKFNSFVTQYFSHHFGENGLRYLRETISDRPVKCPQWYTNSILRAEVDAIVRAFETPVGFFQSLVVKHKATSEYRYQVHRVVGMLDYMINHNCVPLNSWKMYHDQVVLRYSMTGKIREFASFVYDRSRRHGSYRRKVVRHCLKLIGRLVWIPSEEKPDSDLFQVIPFLMKQANVWCSHQSHVGNCATIYYLLSHGVPLPDPRKMLSIRFAQEGFFGGRDPVADILYSIESIHNSLNNINCSNKRTQMVDRQLGDVCRFVRASFILAERPNWHWISEKLGTWFRENQLRMKPITSCDQSKSPSMLSEKIPHFFTLVFGRPDAPRKFEHEDTTSLKDLAVVHST